MPASSKPSANPSEQAVHLVHITARDVQRRVVPADGLFVRAFEQAVDLAVGVVEKLDLPHAELIADAVPGALCDLLDRFGGQFQVIVVVHEPRHFLVPPVSGRFLVTMPAWPAPCPPRGTVRRTRGGVSLTLFPGVRLIGNPDGQALAWEPCSSSPTWWRHAPGSP